MNDVLDVAGVRKILDTVTDPEIPVLTIHDIGILRDVVVDSGAVIVTITPTYSGCPAMDTIRDDITAALHGAGIHDVQVQTVLAPAWTTDWMSDDGRRKLNEYGIAPPRHDDSTAIRCPRCRSEESHVVSQFGSTACKALLVCDSCGEPFDHFKEF
jgi:ring-1,2-phenylacetyl-CoA epoxidase subunit PaaD